MQNMYAEEDLSLLTAAVDQAKAVTRLFPASTSYQIAVPSKSAVSFISGAEASSTLDDLDYTAKDWNPFNNSYTSATGAAHVFVFSDFQKRSFQPGFLSKADSTKQYHLVPLKPGTFANVFVDSVYLEDEFVRPSGDNILHIRVYNAGNEPVEDCPVRLIIDDRQVATLSIDLAPLQATEATLGFALGEGGTKKAYVSVEDYPVEFDNTFHFVLAPSKQLSIAEVTEDTNSPLQRLYNNETFFKATRYGTGSIDYARLSAADVLILNGVKDISAALASTVSTYVKAGGSVLVIPPADGDKSSYTSLFQTLGLPASFTASSGNAVKTALMAPGKDNPFFRNTFSDYDPKMKMPAAVRSMAWSRSSEDILKYRGGAPFLSRFEKGEGQVYLMAAPLDEEYNELPSHALFVPVMYKLAIRGYKQEQQLAYSLAGGSVSIPAVQTTTREGIYKLAKDSAEYIPEQQMRGGRLIFNVPADMSEAGFYELRLNDKPVTTLAFNYDKKESFLESYTPDELRSFLTSGQSNVHVYDYSDEFSVKGEFEKRYFGVKLWKYCLILCLFFLMAEIALIRLL
ncbi:hypothetical protein [Pontibacter ruber]|uniref:Uncharacterized protein n=1 Tax=Pontibacter ruber TaxID=1343895 RepID=A0ABW5CWY7_9BACT|nr:hypothetical protein [Pontibacter ruber]